MKIIFFGSTSDSVIVGNAVLGLQQCSIVCAVTQPPKPVGRDKTITRTPVEIWAKEHAISTLSFPSDRSRPWLYEQEQAVIDSLAPFDADVLISASYGQKIPSATIHGTKFGGLNVHPSVLPRWRGADPVPWAMLAGDHQVGVTVVTLSDAFDEGRIVAQKKIPVRHDDYADPLRTKLFTLGAELLSDVLKAQKDGPFQGHPQNVTDSPYARKFTRDDGFIPWPVVKLAISGIDVALSERPKPLALINTHIADTIERAYRALSPWPGLWTTVTLKNGGQKRLKLLSVRKHADDHILIIDTVQLEGKQPVSWDVWNQAYGLI